MENKNSNFNINCLAFADDLKILYGSTDIETEKINLLKEIAKKAGSQISF